MSSSNPAAEIFRSLDRELWIVTAEHAGTRGGLIANSATSVSIVPELPRVLVALSHSHRTQELVMRSGGFALHLVHPGQHDRIARFGLQSAQRDQTKQDSDGPMGPSSLTGEPIDKFAGLTVGRAATGAPILPDAPAWLDCRVETALAIGDRTVFLGEVVASERVATDAPLTLHQWLKLASPAEITTLRAQMAEDAARDAEAIRVWRKQQSV